MMVRMLGLAVNVESSSAADFELVTRLEKLILANQKNITSTLPVDQADITSTLPFDHKNITSTLQVNQKNITSTLPVDQADITSTLPVDHGFSEVAAAFRSRRADDQSRHHQHDDDDDDDDDVPDSSRSNQCHSARTRSRSLSPMRTRDPNIY